MGWKVRRAFAILTNEEKTHEAIDVIKMHGDAKNQEENLFFKQIIEKFPEMMILFHEKMNEILNSSKWPERPVVKKKVLVSINLLISRQIKTFLNLKDLIIQTTNIKI